MVSREIFMNYPSISPVAVPQVGRRISPVAAPEVGRRIIPVVEDRRFALGRLA